jgi:hypothetical protein
LWALLVGVSDGVHDHLRIKASTITIDFVGELVVDEKKNHEIAGYSNALWILTMRLGSKRRFRKS